MKKKSFLIPVQILFSCLMITQANTAALFERMRNWFADDTAQIEYFNFENQVFLDKPEVENILRVLSDLAQNRRTIFTDLISVLYDFDSPYLTSITYQYFHQIGFTKIQILTHHGQRSLINDDESIPDRGKIVLINLLNDAAFITGKNTSKSITVKKLYELFCSPRIKIQRKIQLSPQ